MDPFPSIDLAQSIMALAIFAGAIVSSFAGFAFSAAAGAILLHLLPPSEAVPLMMVCSVLVQSISLYSLRRHVRWRSSATLAAGGLLGLPPALYVLTHAEPTAFRIGFGALLTLYSGYMLLRPKVRYFENVKGLRYDAAIGFLGGLIGGMTAMPGAVPTIWCDLRGLPKEQQRGLVQPYIAAMQLASLALLAMEHGLHRAVLRDLILGLAPLGVGTFVGLALFGRVNDGVFRRVLLTVLLVSGLTFVL